MPKIASLLAGTTMLRAEPQSAKGSRILAMMRDTLGIVDRLVDNVMDFARGRLGGGVSLDRRATEIGSLVAQAADEIRVANPRRPIDADYSADRTITLDPVRIYQLITNLLGNAITHGTTEEPITVRCGSEDGVFRLSVANGGTEIPLTARARLFEPFERNSAGNRYGLGLGLYIASQIAEAHDGVLTAVSSPSETIFTFKMPIVQDQS